ncbi:MAG: YceI family protein [Bacteriovorax sp.]|nr:YceI family protein [Bacteriovorax sp.]
MFKNLLLATVLLSSVSVYAKTEAVAIDPAASKIVFIGKKVTGEHTGEVKLQDGTLNFDGAAFKGGEFTVDMTTITNNDLTDKEYNKKFTDHMNSDEFFATSANKTAKFVTTKVKKVKGDTYAVTGNLTIKGKTNPVTFNADVTKAGATAVLKIDRTKYDIKYGSGKFFQGLGDKMINDEFQLTVTLVTKK